MQKLTVQRKSCLLAMYRSVDRVNRILADRLLSQWAREYLIAIETKRQKNFWRLFQRRTFKRRQI